MTDNANCVKIFCYTILVQYWPPFKVARLGTSHKLLDHWANAFSSMNSAGSENRLVLPAMPLYKGNPRRDLFGLLCHFFPLAINRCCVINNELSKYVNWRMIRLINSHFSLGNFWICLSRSCVVMKLCFYLSPATYIRLALNPINR